MTVAVDGDVVAENDDDVDENGPVDVNGPVDCGADDGRNCYHCLKNGV